MKRKFFKEVGFVAGTLLKGGLKSIPIGNAAVKVVEHFTKKDLATGEEKVNPINWNVIIIEVAGVITLGFLVIKGVIPVEHLIEFINKFI